MNSNTALIMFAMFAALGLVTASIVIGVAPALAIGGNPTNRGKGTGTTASGCASQAAGTGSAACAPGKPF